MTSLDKIQTTHSTMEDKYNRFLDGEFFITPKGNIIPTGKYCVVDGKLQKVKSKQCQKDK